MGMGRLQKVSQPFIIRFLILNFTAMTEKDEDVNGPYQLSASYLSQHNNMHSKPAPPLDFIVVRIEVTDTGCGIRRRDMIQSKLFCA